MPCRKGFKENKKWVREAAKILYVTCYFRGRRVLSATASFFDILYGTRGVECWSSFCVGVLDETKLWITCTTNSNNCIFVGQSHLLNMKKAFVGLQRHSLLLITSQWTEVSTCGQFELFNVCAYLGVCVLLCPNVSVGAKRFGSHVPCMYMATWNYAQLSMSASSWNKIPKRNNFVHEWFWEFCQRGSCHEGVAERSRVFLYHWRHSSLHSAPPESGSNMRWHLALTFGWIRKMLLHRWHGQRPPVRIRSYYSMSEGAFVMVPPGGSQVR